MKTSSVCAALACAMLTMTGTATIAEQSNGWYGAIDLGIAVAGVNVTIGNRSGDVVARAKTNAKGQIRTSSLPPGEYEMMIDGPALVAAVDRLAPEKKSDRGLSLGIGGGMFGGGSSRSSSGHEGMNGHPDSGHGSSRSSGGGVGVGMNIPIGGGNPDTRPTAPTLSISVKVAPVGAAPSDRGQQSTRWGAASSLDDGTGFSVQTPYCPDAAGQGMRIGFTVPQGGGPVAFEVGYDSHDSR